MASTGRALGKNLNRPSGFEEHLLNKSIRKTTMMNAFGESTIQKKVTLELSDGASAVGGGVFDNRKYRTDVL